MRAAGGVVQGEDLHVVAQLAQRGRRRRAGQAGAHDEHVVLAAVIGVYQLKIEFVRVPFLFYRSRGNMCVEFHCSSKISFEFLPVLYRGFFSRFQFRSPIPDSRLSYYHDLVAGLGRFQVYAQQVIYRDKREARH